MRCLLSVFWKKNWCVMRDCSVRQLCTGAWDPGELTARFRHYGNAALDPHQPLWIFILSRSHAADIAAISELGFPHCLGFRPTQDKVLTEGKKRTPNITRSFVIVRTDSIELLSPWEREPINNYSTMGCPSMGRHGHIGINIVVADGLAPTWY